MLPHYRVCCAHLDPDNLPTRNLPSGLNGKYWKTGARGPYKKSKEELTPLLATAYTEITKIQQELQAKEAIIEDLLHKLNDIQLGVPDPIHHTHAPRAILSSYFRVCKYRFDSTRLRILLGVRDWEQLEWLTDFVRDDLPNIQRSDIFAEDIVAMLLLRLRRGMTYGTIAALYYDMSESRIQQLCNHITPLLAQHLKQYVSLLPKEEMLKHTPNKLKEKFPDAKIFVCDDTYVYIQHSDDFMAQHQSFSDHKYRNLLKFFIGCAADGTIVFVLGPFWCEDDDKVFQKALAEGLEEWLEYGDVVYLDRGFKVADGQVPYDVHIMRPHYLRGRPQFTETEHAESVAVSQIRSVIENVNARLKHFKIFANVYPNSALDHLSDYMIIVAALANLAYKPFRGTDWVWRE